MKTGTLNIIKLNLEMDDTIPPEVRSAILDFCKNPKVSSVCHRQPVTFLSPSEVAKALGLGLRTVQRLISTGVMPSRKIFSCRRIPSYVLDVNFPMTLSRPTKAKNGRKPTDGLNHEQDSMDKAS